MERAEDIEAALLSMADERDARILLRFFKTGPGEYGEGDKFAGLRNPKIRMVVKEAWKNTSLEEAVKLAHNKWHEVRLCGLLIMVEKYLKAMKQKDHPAMRDIFSIYVSLHPFINNWDLVDLSAIKIVGNHEVQNPDLTLMDEWILPEGHTLWQQRISMVSTWISTRHDNADLCYERAGWLIDSPHDLLHKAAGWMLRETWKKGYETELRGFLDEHIHSIPSIMLSYACEKMTPDERHAWQTKRKSGLRAF